MRYLRMECSGSLYANAHEIIVRKEEGKLHLLIQKVSLPTRSIVLCAFKQIREVFIRLVLYV